MASTPMNPQTRRPAELVMLLQCSRLNLFQRSKGIFLAPHPVDFIEILGANGRIRFTPDVSLRFHEIKDIVVVTLDRFPVFPDTVTLRKLKVVGNKPL